MHSGTRGLLVCWSRSLTHSSVQDGVFLPLCAIQVQMSGWPRNHHGVSLPGRAQCVPEVTELSYCLTSLSLRLGDTSADGTDQCAVPSAIAGPCLRDSWQRPCQHYSLRTESVCCTRSGQCEPVRLRRHPTHLAEPAESLPPGGCLPAL